MKIAILALTKGGKTLATRLESLLPDAAWLRPEQGQKIQDLFTENWKKYDGFVCIMATGIVVRTIAPLLKDKNSDPCVVVLDERAQHAISLLSGHVGGGNALTQNLARLIGATAVITTASDVLGLAPLDIWAKENDLTPHQKETLTTLSAKLVSDKNLTIYSDILVENLPAGLTFTQNRATADIVVSHELQPTNKGNMFFPKNLVVGIGCNRGTPENEFEDALDELFAELQISRNSIRNLASIDKKNDEIGLLAFAENNSWTIDFFTKTEINSLTNLEISFAALKAVGAIGVAEPSSLLSAQSNLLLCRKRKWKNVTMAVAQVSLKLSAPAQDH